MIQFSEQLISTVTFQFISGISRVLQKLIKCYNGTTISTLAVPELLVLSLVLGLNLNNLEFVIYIIII